jgi:2-oxoglutarate dehydrogenase E1 component
VSQERVDDFKSRIRAELEAKYILSKSLKYKAEDWMTEDWNAVQKKYDKKTYLLTGLPVEKLTDIGLKITVLPKEGRDGGSFHKLVGKIFEAREKSIVTGKEIDWGTAEALAFASLI